MSYRIDQIEIYRVSMPLLAPYGTAFGLEDAIESVLVKIGSGDQYGWGEAASWKHPGYCPECAATQFLISRDYIAPLLLGKEIESGASLQEHLDCIKGNRFAKAEFDLAWWDLDARSKGLPLWKVLGGKNPVVDAGAAFGTMDSVDALLEKISGAVKAGYKRVKLKYHPGWDLFMLEAVRAAFPSVCFHIDCNSAYSLDDLDMFRRIDRLGLAMIEQPLAEDDLLDHAELQKQINTPICLDESVESLEHARKAVQLGSCKWVNIKPGRVGGITNALAIHDFLAETGIPCWIGGMLESAIGESHMTALATLSNIRYPADILPTSRMYARDLGTVAMEHCGPSQFRASDLPGIGVEPDPDMLKRYTIESVRLAG